MVNFDGSNNMYVILSFVVLEDLSILIIEKLNIDKPWVLYCPSKI